MHIRPRSRVRNKISHLLLKARQRIENGISGDFIKSGEASFIHSFAEDHAGQEVVVFDVGANIGSWGEVVAEEINKQGGTLTLHAFEPVAEYHGSGTFTKAAVSATPGTVSVYRRKDSDQSSLYERRLARRKQGEAEIVQIPTIRLDDYITEHKITHIDLLKIDVEGHELSVLQSLGTYLDPAFVSMIQFEYGVTYVDSSTYLLDMYELLHAYKICKVFRDHLEETPYQSNLEDFMFTNYVAIAQ